MKNINTTEPAVVGRFAPSPTGPLHFGTLLAALGSFLAAKSMDGRWLLRIEDLDRPRVVPGAAGSMLRLLERLGFVWDGDVVYQSGRFKRYREILGRLREQGKTFECSCSRREILASAPHPGEEGPVYPGTCRNGPRNTRTERSVRLRVAAEPIVYVDMLRGTLRQNLERQVGDFVLHRADGVFAYQLAVVVDDLDSGVTQVVRGADLLSSTARQVYLYQCLGAVAPLYLHLPLVLGNAGEKLSKRDGGNVVVTTENGGLMIWHGLAFLGQRPPVEIRDLPAREILCWGIEHFRPQAVPVADRQTAFLQERLS